MCGPAFEEKSITEPAHPLALALINDLPPSRRRVLEVGTGSARNLAALMQADMEVTSLDNDAERVSRLKRSRPEFQSRLLCAAYTQLPKTAGGYDAVLSTHALLHGEVSRIRAVLAEIHRILGAAGHAYFTLGSSKDARYGEGRQLGEVTFATISGDEQGVPHSYFDEAGVRSLLERFVIEQLFEHAADDIAGKWAHQTAALSGAVHWFVIVRKAF